MYSRAELKTSASRLESLRDSISTEMQFSGSQQIGAKLENISDVYKTKNAEIEELYATFTQVKDEIKRITILMNQDPEDVDNGIAYIKRR